MDKRCDEDGLMCRMTEEEGEKRRCSVSGKGEVGDGAEGKMTARGECCRESS